MREFGPCDITYSIEEICRDCKHAIFSVCQGCGKEHFCSCKKKHTAEANHLSGMCKFFKLFKLKGINGNETKP